jgi:GNAT superfamily N-acetyltransferase
MPATGRSGPLPAIRPRSKRKPPHPTGRCLRRLSPTERCLGEQIFTAGNAADYQAFASLVTEYVHWSRMRYAADPWFVEQVFGYQSLESELKTLAETYGPPNGTTLLARRDHEICGGGAFRHFSHGSCEMKRLFVPQRFAGAGIGRRLCQELMRTAAARGYRRMLLDTGNLLKEAISLYHSLGFRECPPYRQYPDELMPFLLFMEAELPQP